MSHKYSNNILVLNTMCVCRKCVCVCVFWTEPWVCCCAEGLQRPGGETRTRLTFRRRFPVRLHVGLHCRNCWSFALDYIRPLRLNYMFSFLHLQLKIWALLCRMMYDAEVGPTLFLIFNPLPLGRFGSIGSRNHRIAKYSGKYLFALCWKCTPGHGLFQAQPDL